MHYKLPIFVLAIFCFLLSFSYFNSPSSSDHHLIYKCPPCGCSHDNKIFENPGKCEMCSMDLYKMDHEYQEFVAFTTPLLADNLVTFYSKVIYPALVMGIILGMISLFKLKGKTFNPFLGSIILILALYGFKNQLYGVGYGLSGNYRLLFVPISFILFLGPLIFFYTKSLIGTFDWSTRQLIHLIPGVVFFTAYLILLVGSDELKNEWMLSRFEPFFGHYEQFFSLISILIYLYLSARLFHSSKASLKDTFKLTWLTRFHWIMLSLSLVWFAILFINFEVYDMGIATLTYNPLWLAISMVIYWVLIESILNPKHFFIPFHYSSAGNGYSHEKIESDKVFLLQTMKEERPYLDPSLSLDKLAKQIEMNPKYLSLVLNNGFNKNFYEFINEYRIEAVKQLLVSPRFKHLTIAAIATEAGFNSKSSFNSIFKKYTDQTPKEYLKDQKIALES